MEGATASGAREAMIARWEEGTPDIQAHKVS
jgi:hypothetical protein